MKHSILVIDDEKIQAEGLKKQLQKARESFFVESAFEEVDIISKVENLYYNIAIVDLRMDNYEIDGFVIIDKILEINPFSKIIIVSGYIKEYIEDIQEIIKRTSTGRIAAWFEKTNVELFTKQILSEVDKIVADFEANTSQMQKTLEGIYADAKNEKDNFLKGTKFERFVTVLFSQMGFNHINSRVKDRSSNEVDLIVRNEISDVFFQKFKQYILIECKNTSEPVGKNEFIQFKSKLENTNSLSDLGILISSGSIAKTTYIEAVRTSKEPFKIVFISNNEIKRLIYANDMLSEFKKIIDEQVKDN